MSNWRRYEIKDKKRRKNRIKWNLPDDFKKNMILTGVVALAFGSLVFLAMFAWVSRDLPDPNELSDRSIVQSTKIYDRTGEHLLYEIYGNENRTLVKLEEIPDFVKYATISVEDQRFYKHKGFNPVRIIKGFVLGVFRGRVQGGSTITQQLVKNAILSNERTVVRKIKELILSIELERRYSKDEILQLYFNEIPYGSTNYGVESAAHAYFGKSVRDVTLSEAAVLASLPKAPTRYLNNPDLLMARRDLILDLMVSEKYISKEQATEAKQENIELKERIDNILAPHFVLYVKQQLEEKYGERVVEQGGLKVVTSLDFEMQKIAEEEVLRGVDETGKNLNFENAALVALDTKTSHILSMVGSKDFFSKEIDGQVNVALSNRQPGSSIKPIVYTAGFKNGYTPNTILYDVNTTFPTVTGSYSPKNYDLGERGPVRVRQALQGSLNIPAVKMLYLVGVEEVIKFAEELGYTTFGDRSRFGLSLVLGGGEVKLLEHVNAYAVLANEGVQNPTVSILKVEDADGEILEEWKIKDGKKVIEENIARMTTNVLSDDASRAYVFGAGGKLTLPGRPVAAKTGTTNDYRDAWVVGYTPDLVAGVWAGNNDNSAMVRGAGGSMAAVPIWNAFMRRALEGKPVSQFNAPSIQITGKDVLDGKIPGKALIIDKASGKLATDLTPASYKKEVIFAEYFTILKYVDRGDPLGGVPSNPDKDPMYTPWQSAIENWIARKEAETGISIKNGEPPTEQDDLHVPANFPFVNIDVPVEGDEIASRNVAFHVSSSAPRGISRVEYYFDNAYLGASRSAPFSFLGRIPNSIASGSHTIKAVAYDDIDNKSQDEISIRLSAPSGGSIKIIDPIQGQIINPTAPEYNIVVEVGSPSSYSRVTLEAENIQTGQIDIVKFVENPSSPFITFAWTLPQQGNYVLRARGLVRDGAENSESISVPVYVAEKSPEGGAQTGGTNNNLNPFQTQ